jgi:hypothetical protein
MLSVRTIRPIPFLLALAVLAAGCATTPAVSVKEAVTEAGQTVVAAGQEVTAKADEHQAAVSRTLADLVDRTDKVFGEPRVEDRQEIVRAKVGIKSTIRENESTGWSVPSNFRLPLPALERKANIFLDITTDTDTGNLDDLETAAEEKESSLSATILSRVTDMLDFGLTLGVHGGPEFGPELFVRYEHRWEPWMLFGEQRGYWRTDNGWGGTTALNLDYRLPGEKAYIRWGNRAEYHEELQDADLKTYLAYRRPFLMGSAVSVETGVDYNPYDGDPSGDGDPDPEGDDDEVYARIRAVGKAWRPWIEWEITPGYYYRWEHDEPGAWGVDLRLSIIYEAFLRGQP